MSQMEPQTKTIDGDTYRVLMLDPFIASDLLVDLTDIFGPALAAVGSSVLKAKDSKAAFKQLMDGESGSDGVDLLGDNLERAVSELIKGIDKAKQRQIIELLAGVTSVQKGDNWPQLSSVFGVHFQGRLKAMYKWLGFAVRSQFEDFF